MERAKDLWRELEVDAVLGCYRARDVESHMALALGALDLGA